MNILLNMIEESAKNTVVMACSKNVYKGYIEEIHIPKYTGCRGVLYNTAVCSMWRGGDMMIMAGRHEAHVTSQA